METAKHKSLQLMDVTLRTGGLRIQNNILPDQVPTFAQSIGHAGVSYMEISHGLGFGAFERGYPALVPDHFLLKKAFEAEPRLSLGIFLSTVPSDVPPFEASLPYFQWAKVGVDYREVEKAGPFVEALKKAGKKAFVQLLYIHHGKPEQSAAAAKKAAELGTDGIYLTDSFGSMRPQDVKNWIQAVRSACDLPIGFQARNHSDWALANSLAAAQEQIQFLDGSIYGMGMGAGYTVLELLASHLQNQGECKNINLNEFYHISRSLAWGIFHSVPAPDALELLYSKHRLDFFPREILAHLAQILELGLEELLIEIKKVRPEMTRIMRHDLEAYLETKKIRLDVVLEYLRTGEIPLNPS